MTICDFIQSQFYSDLTIAVIGSAIGILGSLYIFRKTIKKDKDKEDQKRKDYLEGRLKWTNELLKDVIIQAKNPSEKYTEQGNSIITNPFKYYVVEILASNQIDRLQRVDSQDLFDAFLNKFGDGEATIKKYKTFLNKVDFLSKLLEMAFRSNEENIENFGKEQENLRLKIDAFYSNFVNLKTDPQLSPDIRNVMSKYWEEFQKYIGTGEADLQEMYIIFFIPLFDKIKNLSSNDNVSGSKILLIIREITTLMHHMSGNNLYYAKRDALTLKARLEDSINSLDGLSNELI